MDKLHFDKSVNVLLHLIDWRNAVYNRIGCPFPSQDQLKAKHERVSRKANALYEAWTTAYEKATPYLHAICHNEAYLHCDVVDRSAEALEHLNKIMKSITKRGLKRYTSVQMAKEQRAKATAEGRDHRGLHLGATGTTKSALTQSVAASHFRSTQPARHSYYARRQAKEGRISKEIVADKMAEYTCLRMNSASIDQHVDKE